MEIGEKKKINVQKNYTKYNLFKKYLRKMSFYRVVWKNDVRTVWKTFLPNPSKTFLFLATQFFWLYGGHIGKSTTFTTLSLIHFKKCKLARKKRLDFLLFCISVRFCWNGRKSTKQLSITYCNISITYCKIRFRKILTILYQLVRRA